MVGDIYIYNAAMFQCFEMVNQLKVSAFFYIVHWRHTKMKLIYFFQLLDGKKGFSNQNTQKLLLGRIPSNEEVFSPDVEYILKSPNTK